MRDLIKQEQFELEVLDRLNSGKFLNDLVFSGGTMLRLCFGLTRFSVDLDFFWVVKKLDYPQLHKNLREYLGRFYNIKDDAEKFYTLLFEIKSPDYPRNLKIEIRKEPKKIELEQAIAYSKHSNRQVILKIVSLPDMMKSKTEAFLQRKEIRDVFDLEFLVKKGVVLDEPVKNLKAILKEIESLSKNDYAVKLASLIEKEQRKYYLSENFKILKSIIREAIDSSVIANPSR